ncbi:hypothetical protein D9M71_375740 [compost metagenome]
MVGAQRGQRSDRTQVQNPAATPCPHQWDCRLAQGEWHPQVMIERAFEHRHRHRFDAAVLGESRVVDQDVQPAGGSGCACHQAVALGRQFQVGGQWDRPASGLRDQLDRLGQRAWQAGGLLQTARADHHCRPFCGEALGNGAADATAGTRDECDLAGEFLRYLSHGNSLLSLGRERGWVRMLVASGQNA